MDTNEQTWTLLARPSGGHRYFKHCDGHVSAADNSGARPDLTDDGPLWLDHERPATVELDSSRLVVTIPVLQSETFDGARGRDRMFVISTAGDLSWLIRHGHWGAENVNVKASAAALHGLFQALR